MTAALASPGEARAAGPCPNCGQALVPRSPCCVHCGTLVRPELAEPAPAGRVLLSAAAVAGAVTAPPAATATPAPVQTTALPSPTPLLAVAPTAGESRTFRQPMLLLAAVVALGTAWAVFKPATLPDPCPEHLVSAEQLEPLIAPAEQLRSVLAGLESCRARHSAQSTAAIQRLDQRSGLRAECERQEMAAGVQLETGHSSQALLALNAAPADCGLRSAFNHLKSKADTQRKVGGAKLAQARDAVGMQRIDAAERLLEEAATVDLDAPGIRVLRNELDRIRQEGARRDAAEKANAALTAVVAAAAAASAAANAAAVANAARVEQIAKSASAAQATEAKTRKDTCQIRLQDADSALNLKAYDQAMDIARQAARAPGGCEGAEALAARARAAKDKAQETFQPR